MSVSVEQGIQLVLPDNIMQEAASLVKEEGNSKDYITAFFNSVVEQIDSSGIYIGVGMNDMLIKSLIFASNEGPYIPGREAIIDERDFMVIWPLRGKEMDVNRYVIISDQNGLECQVIKKMRSAIPRIDDLTDYGDHYAKFVDKMQLLRNETGKDIKFRDMIEAIGGSQEPHNIGDI